MSELRDRLQKNYRRLAAQFRSQKVEAWRLYAQDIPRYPYLIDVYNNFCLIYDQGRSDLVAEEVIEEHHNDALRAVQEVLNLSAEQVIFKKRERQKGEKQYEIIDPRAEEMLLIQEGELRFEVNLRKYLDTGLFLDHRPLRRELQKISHDKKVLNLFCYTGSLSIAAAAGGASEVTSIDMSRTYLDWTLRNFKHNQLSSGHHRFVQADILAWLKADIEESWDIIVLDPPSFSNSKRMEDILDIERDHSFLIKECMKRLSHSGVLFFSTNKRKFKIDALPFKIKEITHWTTPMDFKDTGIHKAWEIRHN